MRCLNPIMMYDTGKVTANGKRCLSPKANPRLPFEQYSIPVPCGKCAACKLSRSLQWVARLRLECLETPCSSFVTLTYSKEPEKLIKSDVQNFIKRLRNVPRDFGISMPNLRYFVAGEYGSRNGRPHWHGIIFGVDFLASPWRPYMPIIKDGFPIYSSRLLEHVWSHGFVTVDRANDSTIKYVSKYILKDGSCLLHSQGLGRSPFVRVVRRGRHVDYNLRPFFLDSLDNGTVLLPDKKGFSSVGIPKAFDRYIERCDSSLFASVKSKRLDFVKSLNPNLYSCGELRLVTDYRKNQTTQRGILHD